MLLFIFSVVYGFSIYDYDLDSFRNAGPYEVNFTDYYGDNHSISFNAKTVPDASRTKCSDCNVVDFKNGEYTCYGQMKNIHYSPGYEYGVLIFSDVMWDKQAYIYLTCSESNQTIVNRVYASAYEIQVYMVSPWGCKGTGHELPKATIAKCKKPRKVETKLIGVKETIKGCKKGCFTVEYNDEDEATSCVECSYLKEESECDLYDTCHFKNGKCRANSCPQWVIERQKEADDELTVCLNEYGDRDEKASCHFQHNHLGRLVSAEEHKEVRMRCQYIYGCMYNKNKARCSFMAVWAFIVTLATSITFVIVIVIIVVVCCYKKKKRGDYGPINGSDISIE